VLVFGDLFAYIAAESLPMVNWSLVWYLVTSLIMSGLPKGMEHLAWCFIRCFVAIAVIWLSQAIVQGSMMEVDRGVDGFSPTLDSWLEVNHDSLSLLGDGTDHSLSDSILVLRAQRAQFICCIAGSGHRAEGLVIELPSAIITSELFDLIALAKSMNSGLKGLVGGGASFRLLTWEHPDVSEAGIVVNE
jgi:hypothetical protein